MACDGSTVERDSYPFEMSLDVSASTETSRELTVPYDGRVTKVIIGWPSGANNKVGVGFRTKGGIELIPRNSDEDYIAANDFTHPFDVQTDVAEDDVLVAEFNNTDATNAHFINVFVEIRKDADNNR